MLANRAARRKASYPVTWLSEPRLGQPCSRNFQQLKSSVPVPQRVLKGCDYSGPGLESQATGRPTNTSQSTYTRQATELAHGQEMERRGE
jgi:hypothetical protein